MNDFALTLRAMAARPGFFAACIVTLALGVGSVSAIFSVVNGVLLASLPYPDAERIVRVNRVQGRWGGPVSPPVLEDWRAATEGQFSSVAAFTSTTVNLTGDGAAMRLSGHYVTPEFWDVMRVQPALGRWFTAAEDAALEPVVALSHALWTERFGADPAIVGRDIRIDGEARRVVGVAPREFKYPGGAQVFLPANLGAEAPDRGSNYMFVIARLADGATIEQADAALEVENARLRQTYPDENDDLSATLTPLPDMLNSGVKQPLLILLGASALVLLIACANLANLLLARANQRERELALRSALGAGRARLLRAIGAEVCVIALLGGLLGVGLAALGVPVLLSFAPSVLPSHASPAMDLRAVAVSLGVALTTVIAFAAWPAVRSSRVNHSAVLKQESRGSGGRDKARVRSALVVAEVALSLTLLVGAGLLIESLRQLDRLDTGVDAANVLTAAFMARGAPEIPGEPLIDGYLRETTVVAPQLDAILERVAAIPGVEHVGLTDSLPLSGVDKVSSSVTVPGYETPEGQPDPGANWRFVSPGLFDVLGMRVVQGRALNAADGRPGEEPRQVLVNATFAERFLAGSDPVGQQITFMSANPKTIVGVVADTRLHGLDSDVIPEIYMPHAQGLGTEFYLALRVRGEPLAYAEQLRAALRDVDVDIPLYNVRTMDQVIGEPIQLRRFNMLLMTVFSGVALVLAALGLYGVIAYAVAQRRQEIGIRVSLGASPRGILGLVLKQGGTLVGAGLIIGLVGAYGLTRVIASQLYGVQPGDPAVLAAVVATMAVVGLFATLVPARQAARVSPMEALRDE